MLHVDKFVTFRLSDHNSHTCAHFTHFQPVCRAYDSNTHFMKYNNEIHGIQARLPRQYLNNNADTDLATHRWIKSKISSTVPISLKFCLLGYSEIFSRFRFKLADGERSMERALSPTLRCPIICR